MSENRPRYAASSIDKRGGYSGGRPAHAVAPPPRTPSATIRPAQQDPDDKPTTSTD